ncbi:hypothetical protein [Rhodococcus erythropolis]|uniref:hypothetical protein n=1 Tax=Rhodococcus erythropolis TaxID=1833 RepID=UPI00038E4E16|nr:hypothetical protein [Rhodococcus erythropolis]EQM31672.1 hypothetical protein N601_21215 [Rhodococcus erythropolis DN1]
MVVFPVPFRGAGVVGDRGGGAVHEVHESISLSPLLRRSTAALCVVLGIVLVIVCGFAAIVQRDPVGYVGAALSAVLSFGLAAYMWKVRVIITTDVERVSIALSPGLRQVFRWDEVVSATAVHIGMGSGIGYRMTGPGMRVILASPGAGVRFRLDDGREIWVATDRRDELIELARRRAPDLQ